MKDYHSTHAIPYEKPSRVGWTTIRVLEFLEGSTWDERALAFVHALQPRSIRVTTGEETCDANTWRVTVIVDDRDVIRSIRQEVEIGLADDWQNGWDAEKWAKSVWMRRP